uniref:Uncharacterized protein n=1 Tax=Strongyloides papillosus TaxID=174720 RepID=A0A0N5C3J8_STREA
MKWSCITLLFLLSLSTLSEGRYRNALSKVVSENADNECGDFYGMFFMDKSLGGSSIIQKQKEIIKDFFNSNFKPTLNSLVAASSQVDDEITNPLNTVKPFDYSSLEKQFSDISSALSTNETVSFYKLVLDVWLNADLSNSDLYTKNPIIVLFINSYVEDKNPTQN